MSVRVVNKDGVQSEWSKIFSLDTVGSEGVFLCKANSNLKAFRVCVMM